MNRKGLFVIAPAVIIMSALTGCHSFTLDHISAKCDKSFIEGDTIKKSDIEVTAYYSNNKSNIVTDWACSALKNDMYTFTNEDSLNGKTFVIDYQGIYYDLKIDVGIKGPEYLKYLRFYYIEGDKKVVVDRNDTRYIPSSGELSIPGKVLGKYIGDQTSLDPDTEYEVSSIEDAAFSAISTIKSVVIPNTITDIGDSAFYQCSELSKVTFEENSKLEYIYGKAFQDCSNLTEIELPDSVFHLGDYAFANTKLKSINVPEKLQKLGDTIGAFQDVNTFESVTFEDTSKIWIIDTEFSAFVPSSEPSENASKLNSYGSNLFTTSTLELTAEPSSIKVGETTTISYETSGASFSIYNRVSTNESVATINNENVVTAVGAGTTYIIYKTSIATHGVIEITVTAN